MNKTERENYFNDCVEELLIGGTAISEWCTFVSKSVYDSFVNGADLATVITALACIEAYCKIEYEEYQKSSLSAIIDSLDFLSTEDKVILHSLRKYRNHWVHFQELDDSPILENEQKYIDEAEQNAILAVRLLIKVLFSNAFI